MHLTSSLHLAPLCNRQPTVPSENLSTISMIALVFISNLAYSTWHIVHRLPRSKWLPRWLPLLYVLGAPLNSRGGGKSVTGNVCIPAFGGGDGTLFTELSVGRYCIYNMPRTLSARRRRSVPVAGRWSAAWRRRHWLIGPGRAGGRRSRRRRSTYKIGRAHV